MRSLAKGLLFIGLIMVGYAGNSYLRAPDMAADQATASGAGQGVDLKALVDGMGDQMKQVARGSRRPRAYLPRAPEGWTRRPFGWDDRTLLPDVADFGGAASAGAGKAAQRAFVRQKALSSWLYESDGGVVELAAILPKPGAEIAPRPESLAKTPFGVVQGVVWWPVVSEGNQPDAPVLAAALGEVHLFARGQGATEAGMRLLLEAIDYDGLNSTLDDPIPLVGRAAPQLTPEQEQAYAYADLARREEVRRVAKAREKARAEADAAAQAAAANPGGEVRINRFGGKPACGGTAFCSVTGQ